MVKEHEHDGREVLTPANFIVVAATVVAAVSALLVARFTTLSTWTIGLVTLGLVLALAVMFTRLTKVKWFYPAAAWTVIIALIASGLYIEAKGKLVQASPRLQLAGETAAAPKLNFVLQSPATVPWCNTLLLTTTGTVPTGDEILIFDASADSQYNVTSPYNYDGVAIPVNRVPGEWAITPVYIGSRYKQNAQGQNVLVGGKLVGNADYTVAVFAVLVPDTVGQLLHGVTAYNDEWGLKQLPAKPFATAELDTVRNNDVKQCAGPNG